MSDEDTQDWRTGLGARLDRQDQRADQQSELIDSIRGELEINTRKTDELTKKTDNLVKNTDEIVILFQSWKGAMTVLDTIGKAAKPLAAIAALAAAVGAWWASFKGMK